MACGVELPAMRVDLTVESTEETFLWDPRWQFSTGVASVDFLADVRNVVLGSGAGISIKPAIQFAEVRADRPGTGGAVAGTAVIATGAYHFEETLSGAGQFFFRRGIAYRLTAGAFARADVTLHAAFRSCGKILPAQEILFNPTNDSVSVSVFPLTGQLSGVAADKAKLALIGMGNASTTLR